MKILSLQQPSNISTFEVNFQHPIYSVISSVRAATAQAVCKLQYDSEIAEDYTIPPLLHLRLLVDKALEVSCWKTE